MNRIGKTARGFTFIELVISVFIMSVVAIPAILILRTGTRQSAQGMMKITTTLDARRALQRVRQDLENAVFPTQGWNVDVVNKEQLLDIVKPSPAPEYRLLCFPSLNHSGGPLTEDEASFSRKATRVTWRLESASGTSGPFILIRDEGSPKHSPGAPPGEGTARSTVCSRVNYFAIHREPLISEASSDRRTRFVSLYRIVLQLVDRLPGSEIVSFEKGKPAVIQPKGLIIADFFETVVPGFIRGKQLEPFGSQNWHTGITGPTDSFEPPW